MHLVFANRSDHKWSLETHPNARSELTYLESTCDQINQDTLMPGVNWALYYTSAVPVHNMPVRNGPIVAVFSRTAHLNNFTLNAVLPWVLSNTPAECEVVQTNGCRKNRRHPETPRFIVRWIRYNEWLVLMS